MFWSNESGALRDPQTDSAGDLPLRRRLRADRTPPLKPASTHEMPLMMMKTCLALVTTLLTLAGMSTPSLAQSVALWPQRTVTLVVPYSPGTGIDIVARLLAPRLSERWGQPVVVDNRPGSSGNIGAEAVARSQPNGYTLMVNAGSFTIVPALYPHMPYDVASDFTPITKVGVAGYALVSHPTALPVHNLTEFIATLRANPDRYHYASPGNGTPHHLGMELLKMRLGVKVVHVPYKGLSGAMSDLLGGQVEVMFTLIHTALPQTRSGKLRLLALTGATRSPLAPEAPTFREQGIDFMDSLDTWYGVLGPARLPADIINRVYNDTHRVLGSPDIQDALLKQGIRPLESSPEQFAADMRNDLQRWAKLVNDAGITAD